MDTLCFKFAETLSRLWSDSDQTLIRLWSDFAETYVILLWVFDKIVWVSDQTLWELGETLWELDETFCEIESSTLGFCWRVFLCWNIYTANTRSAYRSINKNQHRCEIMFKIHAQLWLPEYLSMWHIRYAQS